MNWNGKKGLSAWAYCLLGLFLISGTVNLKAEEGMWIPMLIEKYQIEHMQEAGLRLSAEDIYSINRDCLTDAIVIFGRGCTGEMISDEGLLLTNHHCGEGAVQSHSSVENDYLTDGYWAMSREEELPNENLSVTYLRHMKEVTAEVTKGFEQGMDPQVRERMVNENMGKIIQTATYGTHYDAVVKPFYHGNEYYLFVYEVFRDVRLVGAPPVAIGNFGADQDNWMWPRHTGDFTLFRVYADKENKPATYDPANKPYKPRKHLEIAAGGIEEGDFTMVLGYPGSTTQYLYSDAVKLMLDRSLPLKIQLRTSRLEIMDRYMKSSDQVRIQYATKYRRVSNAWKKWQGIILGLNRIDAVEKKIEEERAFQQWVDAEGQRQLKYDSLLDQFSHHYSEIHHYSVAVDLMEEAVKPVELFGQVSRMKGMMSQGLSVEVLKNQVERFYRDFHLPIDREIFAAMMAAYQDHMTDSFLPSFFQDINGKYKGDFYRFADDTYRSSLLSDKEQVINLLDIYNKNPEKAIKLVMKDPLAIYLDQFRALYMIRINPVYYKFQHELEKSYQSYMAALLEMSDDRLLYPDANFSMRLTYGNIHGYQPWDGVQYQYATTLSGLMEKGMEEFEDYRVPQKLTKLYNEKDFGRYGVDGTMPVCFIASNHTSGGNSGSPVLDADGRLIGINFDRNWEGTMSDVYYDPSLCRNIAVDIRYVLFIVDKFAGAGYLMDEMKITW
ncbi:MAG: S46 family peptidase [Bacteroidota bacterium]